MPEPRDLPGEVSTIKDLRIELVDPDDDLAMRTWSELMIREHPQGERRMVGRQLRYLIGSAHGWLGAAGFSASALFLEARDSFIGWDESGRTAHSERVVNLSRFLVRPSVRCPNLASFLLGALVRRMGRDFQARYGFSPWLLETFIDEGHRGTCFMAANWVRVGVTKGRGRNDRERMAQETVKDVLVYPLVKDFRCRMGVAKGGGRHMCPLPVEEGLGPGEWAEQEFGSVELGDKRLTDRLMRIAEDRFSMPDASYLEATNGDRAAAKGYYRFIDHPDDNLSPEAIRATHRLRTIERMMAYETVLVVQDTTDLNFSTRRATSGFGIIGSNQTKTKSLGLKVHTSLAMTPEGLPLGILDSVTSAPVSRDGEPGSPAGRPIEEKKSFRWIKGYRECVAAARQMPKSRILCVADREADIFELFSEAEATRKRVGLLVRSRHDRSVEGTGRKLWEEVRAGTGSARVEVTIPRQRSLAAKGERPETKGLPSRTALLTLHFAKVAIAPTRGDLKSLPAVTLWGVQAVEETPPPGVKAIVWKLLTTETVDTPEEAARIVDLYRRRWRIEEWHRILKSGCEVQDHQHLTGERLARAIAIDTVIAWRIQLMTLLGREAPELPATALFDDWEIKVIEALREDESGTRAKGPLALGEATITVARLGGYLNRRSDPPPGAQCMWRGLVYLYGMAAGYRLALTRDGP